MKKRDLNDIAAIEKAISEKYGKETIQNPNGNWDEEKEVKYLKELKNFYKKNKKERKTEEEEGFKIRTKRINSDQSRTCPVCSSYSFSVEDDLYMVKFGCCHRCYIQFIEGREERWKSGWRPNN